jgi:hypothetical protein
MGVLNFEKAYPQIKGLYQFSIESVPVSFFTAIGTSTKRVIWAWPLWPIPNDSYHPVEKKKSYCLTLQTYGMLFNGHQRFPTFHTVAQGKPFRLRNATTGASLNRKKGLIFISSPNVE